MGYNFPASPTVGQVSNGFVWNGYAWAGNGNLAAVAPPGDAPPASPVNGQLWWESDSGNLFLWFTDANSSQWVQISGPGLGDAPADGRAYSRLNGVWVPGWTVIHDETVTVAKQVIDVNLLGFTNLRYRLDLCFRAASADGGVGIQVSTDGGATFIGSTDAYRNVTIYSDIPLGYPLATVANTSLGTLTNTFDNAAAEVPISIDGTIFAGSATRRFVMRSWYLGVGPASERMGGYSVRRSAVGKATHVRFRDDGVVTNHFDVGTRLIVEAI